MFCSVFCVKGNEENKLRRRSERERIGSSSCRCGVQKDSLLAFFYADRSVRVPIKRTKTEPMYAFSFPLVPMVVTSMNQKNKHGQHRHLCGPLVSERREKSIEIESDIQRDKQSPCR